MEVVNARAALLSNYEVLSLLKELEEDHIARTKKIQKIKKDEEAAGTSIPGNIGSVLETSENLRTIEVEAIQYLSSDYLPTSTQTEESITNLVKKLEPYDLTKAEKLQIVNLVPTAAVELYVIVEELEDRFGDQMDALLATIQEIAEATQGAPAAAATTAVNGTTHMQLDETTWTNPADFGDDADAVYDEEMFDDTGEGAGVEGDLDVEED
ncbi:hypothetical protein CC1G_03416 [Coprinopsis cinerea okayama7|uniref:DNA-directed RNA polymerase III subunit RPC9 n=1 Tax=Coprinopsis cinerea (strain Okayama-7 / 130 / ATCC MYA-4618 / FGSC 9003) TaxID=240176 RepID=A8NQN1_COPC7|nr:hypothetical protein CC1G_03416 [Coprinopsis cinerea okayama7\|eukprot:XP_001835634.1 hypothetical protein CC1G_03416 [Coprinopsis cinerea okayama7\